MYQLRFGLISSLLGTEFHCQIVIFNALQTFLHFNRYYIMLYVIASYSFSNPILQSYATQSRKQVSMHSPAFG